MSKTTKTKPTTAADDPRSPFWVPADARNIYAVWIAGAAERGSVYGSLEQAEIGKWARWEAQGVDFRSVWGEPGAEPATNPDAAKDARPIDLALRLIVDDRPKAEALLAHALVFADVRTDLFDQRRRAAEAERHRIADTCPVCGVHDPAAPKRRESLAVAESGEAGPSLVACPTCIAVARVEWLARLAEREAVSPLGATIGECVSVAINAAVNEAQNGAGAVAA